MQHLPKHEAVKHRDKVRAQGEVHTNSIENGWSLLKRSIGGDSHYQVSAKYLDAYLDELEFRSTIGRTLTCFAMPCSSC